MRIAIDSSPLISGYRSRGTGFYSKHLIDSLKKYHPENEYLLFDNNKIPSNSDLVHYPYFEPFFITLPLKKKIKTIITIHDLTTLKFPDLFPVGIKGKLKLKIQSHIARSADAIITDSGSSKKDIETILNIKSSKIFAIPLAAGDEFEKKDIASQKKEKILSKYKIPEKFALYVGDATGNKNLRRMVDAIVEVGIPIVIIGKVFEKKAEIHPWNKDLIFVQEKAKENKNIHILGFVPSEDLVDLYNLASVFVFPSLYEGFGLPVLEAASCGVPIVTTKAGSIPEVIGDAAYFVKPLETESIASGVREVLENQTLQEGLSKEGLKQSRKFSWERTADLTVKVYEEVFKKT